MELPGAAIADLDDDTFKDVIEEHVFPRGDPEVWQALLSPLVVDRTYQVLVFMLNEVNGELAARKAGMESFRQECFDRGLAGKSDWFAAQREFEDWRRRALRFKGAVESRVSRCNQAKRNRIGVATSSESRAYRRGLRDLALAIAAHRAASAEADINAEPHDLRLWDALEHITVPHRREQVSVAQMIEMAVWAPRPEDGENDRQGGRDGRDGAPDRSLPTVPHGTRSVRPLRPPA
jgi:hypothetical protein